MNPRKSFRRRLHLGLTTLLLTALAALGAGCISTKETVYREEARLKVEFENDTAGRLFYEALSRMREHRDTTESHSHVSLPIVFDSQTTVREGESIAYNEAVRQCDSNHDGLITETEARIFAERHPSR
jgi:hypothetical protein